MFKEYLKVVHEYWTMIRVWIFGARYLDIKNFQSSLKKDGWEYKLGAWHHTDTTSRYVTGNKYVIRITGTAVYLVDPFDVTRGPTNPKLLK